MDLLTIFQREPAGPTTNGSSFPRSHLCRGEEAQPLPFFRKHYPGGRPDGSPSPFVESPVTRDRWRSRMPADFTAMAVLMLARGDAASSVRMRKRT
jgi:hypothetical protein